jgi:hypothetical protein
MLIRLFDLLFLIYRDFRRFSCGFHTFSNDEGKPQRRGFDPFKEGSARKRCAHLFFSFPATVRVLDPRRSHFLHFQATARVLDPCSSHLRATARVQHPRCLHFRLLSNGEGLIPLPFAFLTFPSNGKGGPSPFPFLTFTSSSEGPPVASYSCNL